MARRGTVAREMLSQRPSNPGRQILGALTTRTLTARTTRTRARRTLRPTAPTTERGRPSKKAPTTPAQANLTTEIGLLVRASRAAALTRDASGAEVADGLTTVSPGGAT